jgi:hypothetical protein
MIECETDCVICKEVVATAALLAAALANGQERQRMVNEQLAGRVGCGVSSSIGSGSNSSSSSSRWCVCGRGGGMMLCATTWQQQWLQYKQQWQQQQQLHLVYMLCTYITYTSTHLT